MRLVPCTPEYWEFVRALRTDPRAAYGFIQQVEITPEQQQRYMSSHWHEYFIALVGNEPAGYVGCVDGDIRVCTHPDFQKRGVGVFMLRGIQQYFPKGVAKVKFGNHASDALFLTAGYVPTFTIYEKLP